MASKEDDMVSITEVTIISIDRSDEYIWAIEGEILFESDLTTPFSANYIVEDDEFEDFEIEINPGAYDKRTMKKMILEAAEDYED